MVYIAYNKLPELKKMEVKETTKGNDTLKQNKTFRGPTVGAGGWGPWGIGARNQHCGSNQGPNLPPVQIELVHTRTIYNEDTPSAYTVYTVPRVHC